MAKNVDDPRLPGGVKTGTAQMSDGDGGYGSSYLDLDGRTRSGGGPAVRRFGEPSAKPG